MILLYLTSSYPAGMFNIGHNLSNERLSDREPLDILYLCLILYVFHNIIHHKSFSSDQIFP